MVRIDEWICRSRKTERKVAFMLQFVFKYMHILFSFILEYRWFMRWVQKVSTLELKSLSLIKTRRGKGEIFNASIMHRRCRNIGRCFIYEFRKFKKNKRLLSTLWKCMIFRKYIFFVYIFWNLSSLLDQGWWKCMYDHVFAFDFWLRCLLY